MFDVIHGRFHRKVHPAGSFTGILSRASAVASRVDPFRNQTITNIDAYTANCHQNGFIGGDNRK
jgi:hypothetical protein